MKQLYTVFYKKTPNLYVTHYKNENRFIGSRTFKSEDEARSFASTVNTIEIVNYIGQRI